MPILYHLYFNKTSSPYYDRPQI